MGDFLHCGAPTTTVLQKQIFLMPARIPFRMLAFLALVAIIAASGESFLANEALPNGATSPEVSFIEASADDAVSELEMTEVNGTPVEYRVPPNPSIPVNMSDKKKVNKKDVLRLLSDKAYAAARKKAAAAEQAHRKKELVKLAKAKAHKKKDLVKLAKSKQPKTQNSHAAYNLAEAASGRQHHLVRERHNKKVAREVRIKHHRRMLERRSKHHGRIHQDAALRYRRAMWRKRCKKSKKCWEAHLKRVAAHKFKRKLRAAWLKRCRRNKKCWHRHLKRVAAHRRRLAARWGRKRSGVWKGKFWSGIGGLSNVNQAIRRTRKRRPNKSFTVRSLSYNPRSGNWKSLDNFVASFTTRVAIKRNGWYTFFTTSDDGSKLWVNRRQVVNNDGLHGMRKRAGRVFLRKGSVSVKVVTFERGGGAGLYVDWQGPGIRRQRLQGGHGMVRRFRRARKRRFAYRRAKGWKGKFWSGIGGLHNVGQAIGRTRKRRPNKSFTVRSLSYKSTGGNWKGLDRRFRDNFVASLTTRVAIKRNGWYTFFTTSDDGSKLWVNRRQVVNNDGLHGMRKRAGRVFLRKGSVSVKVVTFERGGHAGLYVDWQGPGIRRQRLQG